MTIAGRVQFLRYLAEDFSRLIRLRRVGSRMKTKIREKMDELMQTEENRRKIGEAVISAITEGGSAPVTVKDVKDHEITFRVQRRPAYSR